MTMSASVVLERRLHLDAGPHRATLGRLEELLASFPDTPEAAQRAAVLTNVLAVVARGDAADFAQTADLVEQYGHRVVAPLQNEFDELFSVGTNLPFTTSAIVKLSRAAQIDHLLRRDGHSPEDAHRVATACSRAAFWLLLEGIEDERCAPVPRTAERFRGLLEQHGASAWRPVLANVAANPWGPDVTRLLDLAEEAGMAAPAEAIAHCAEVFKKRHDEADRLEVAMEIRRLVAISGCSQRQFAKYVGTSAPRLSTYVNGAVTPSAAMMLRISRYAHVLARSASTEDDRSTEVSWAQMPASA